MATQYSTGGTSTDSLEQLIYLMGGAAPSATGTSAAPAAAQPYAPITYNGVTYTPEQRDAFKEAFQTLNGNNVPVPNPWYGKGYQFYKQPMQTAMTRMPTGQLNVGEVDQRGQVLLDAQGNPIMEQR